MMDSVESWPAFFTWATTWDLQSGREKLSHEQNSELSLKGTEARKRGEKGKGKDCKTEREAELFLEKKAFYCPILCHYWC